MKNDQTPRYKYTTALPPEYKSWLDLLLTINKSMSHQLSIDTFEWNIAHTPKRVGFVGEDEVVIQQETATITRITSIQLFSKAMRELLPLLSLLPNNIDSAHQTSVLLHTALLPVTSSEQMQDLVKFLREYGEKLLSYER